MKTETIGVEGLPKGWKAVAYRVPQHNEFILCDEGVMQAINGLIKHKSPGLILEKIQPRRIVLEETNEYRQVNDGEWYENSTSGFAIWRGRESISRFKIWREVKETDIPLTNDEPKLSLSVDECKELNDYINGYRMLSNELEVKIEQFIKDK